MTTYMTNDALARARRTDSDTSHLAADDVEAIGSAQRHRVRCLLAVMMVPGSTAAEIARLTDLERHIPSRRLPELRDRDVPIVRNGEPRVCRVTHRMSLTWWPVESEARNAR
jgi:hypothetical protein